MPNVRKKGKKFVGAWVKAPLYRGLKRLSEEQGTPISDLLALWAVEATKDIELKEKKDSK